MNRKFLFVDIILLTLLPMLTYTGFRPVRLMITIRLRALKGQFARSPGQRPGSGWRAATALKGQKN